MTDTELIEIVQTKTAEELTLAEVAELCERMKACLPLQQALAEHLEMERYLADALGRVNLSSEQVLARAVRSVPVQRRRGVWAALSLLLSLALAAGLTWRFLSAERERPGDATDSDAVATVPTSSTSENSLEATTTPSTQRPDAAPAPNTSPEEPQPVVVEPPRKTAPDPYALVDLGEPGLVEAQLKAWFAPVDGQPHSFRTVAPPRGKLGTQAPTTEMCGLWRLRTPWQADAVLRCLFRTVHTCKFHLWNGTEGITLELWRSAPKDSDLSLAAAYRTTRTGKEPLPVTMVLAATDEGEFSRTRTQFTSSGYARLVSTPLDLRHEEGLLTVSSGDVRILSVPFAAAPSEVYFEGEASLQSLGIAPRIALAPLPAPRPTLLDIDKPAELTWQGDQANLAHGADGSVELRAENAAQRVASATLLPLQGVCEVLVQLEGVTPGTGVYLGDDKGQRRYIASFVRDETTGRTLVLETGDAAATVRLSFPTRGPAAFVADKVWLRLLVAPGQLKCWVSDGGVSWARAFEPASSRPVETWASFGLFAEAGAPRRSLRLCRLTLREFRALNSLAPADLVRRAPLVPHGTTTSLSDWLVTAHAARPPEIEPTVWSRACAIRALAHGVSPALGLAMLENLLDHGLEQKVPFDDKVRMLEEALLLVPKSSSAIAQRFVRYYERLGQELQQEGDAGAYGRLRQALYHNPLWSSQVIDVFPEGLAVSELLDQAATGKWEDVERLARIGQIHRAGPSVFEWADSLVGRRHLPKPKQGGGRRAPLPSSWEAAVLLEQDKDGSTDLSEIVAACRASSLRDAGRVITRLKGHAAVGHLSEAGDRGSRGDHSLLPDSGDGQRLTSWPVTLADLVEAHPELRALLRTEFAPEGRLQLRRALDEKDELALEALALRYFGTEEAAEALLWLGDRHLVDGEVAVAVGRYRSALRATEGALRRRLEERLQLAAALLGQPVSAPPPDLDFGETRLSAAALQLLRKQRSDQGIDSRWTVNLPPQSAPKPTAFDLVPRARFEGETGDRPEAVPSLPTMRQRPNIDWFARQIALAVEGNRLIVSNRFQVDCYEIPSGKLQWRSALSRDAARQELPAAAYEYALTPTRPVLAGPRLFVRRLMRGPAGPPNTTPAAVATLACLDTATGKVEWTTTNHLAGRLHYVADPLVIQDQVFAVGHKQAAGGDWMLTLLVHQRSDGRLLADRPLTPVRSSLDVQRGCQLTALEDSCIATVGGSVLCFDLAGNLRWARRPLWIPPEVDPHWLVQSHEPPLVVADRCFVVQPGVLNLVCLAPGSGRLHWQKAVVGLRRLAGLVSDRLIVETDGGFLCLNAATGKEQWRHDAPSLLSSPLCGGPGGLLYCTADAVPTLVWVDLETGREKTRSPLDGLRQVQPRLGPLFVAGERLWAFSGKGNELTRDLIELIPKGQDLPVTPPATEWDAWARTVPAPMRAAAASVLPGWTVFQSKTHAKTGFVAEFQGKREVLCAAAPFVIGRHFDIPATDKPRLLLQVTHEAKGACNLAVDVEGKRLWQQEVSAATSGSWKDWEVDLSAFKGQRVWVVVRHLPRDADTTCSYWSALELRK